MNPLALTSLTKVFETPEGPFVAVKDVNAEIRPGEFVCILGHSGCGKSTVLSMIAGLERATLGGVVIDGHRVQTRTERAVYPVLLLPWLSSETTSLAAARNMPTPWPRTAVLELVGVGTVGQLPSTMSLGTQRCVSLARGWRPDRLLLEPFSRLDSR
jgi:ABC-type nitrate/sulfonate/bicarbonate transport system ATPase subunit